MDNLNPVHPAHLDVPPPPVAPVGYVTAPVAPAQIAPVNTVKAAAEVEDEDDDSQSNPYGLFGTDKDLEKNGIILDYGHFWLRVARAGGANQRYTKLVNHKFKPHRRAIQTETLSDKVAEKLVVEAYAEAVVLGGGSKKFGDGFIPDVNGDSMAVDYDGVIKLFTDLPDLFADVKEQTQRVALFRKQVQEADAKNL